MTNYLADNNNLPQDSNNNNLNSNYCYICYDNHGEIIKSCLCTGTNYGVHRECLEKWIEESDKDYCTVCNYKYKYKLLYKPSLTRFIKLNSKCDNYCNDENNDDNDLISCSIIITIPIIIFEIIISIFNSSFYYHNLVILSLQLIILLYLKKKNKYTNQLLFNILKLWQTIITVIFISISLILALFNQQTCYTECFYNKTTCGSDCNYYATYSENQKYHMNNISIQSIIMGIIIIIDIVKKMKHFFFKNSIAKYDYDCNNAHIHPV